MAVQWLQCGYTMQEVERMHSKKQQGQATFVDDQLQLEKITSWNTGFLKFVKKCAFSP